MNTNDGNRDWPPQVTDRRNFLRRAWSNAASLAGLALGVIPAAARPLYSARPVEDALAAEADALLRVGRETMQYALELGERFRQEYGAPTAPTFAALLAAAEQVPDLQICWLDLQKETSIVGSTSHCRSAVCVATLAGETERLQGLAWALAVHLAKLDGIRLAKQVGPLSVAATAHLYGGLFVSGWADVTWQFRA